MKETQEIINLLFGFHKTIKRAVRATHPNASNASFLRMKVLHLISAGENTVMKDIAREIGITPPSATSLINNLEREGLIERTTDANDRRVILLTTTKKGQAYLDEGRADFAKTLASLFKTLTQEEQKQLISILKKLNA